MNKNAFASAILCLIISHPIQPDCLFNTHIWNIGQGSWTTFVKPGHCLHLDVGGEKFPWQALQELCKGKQNMILISHPDWDHINGLIILKQRFTNLCRGPSYPWQKLGYRNLPPCLRQPELKILYQGESQQQGNADSWVYLLKGKLIIPGDSLKNQEQKWSRQLNRMAKILILGHHGSNTSSSEVLLTRVKIDLAIASARKSKYGHPHPKVKARLKKHHIPLITTEDWGHIHLQL
ncbi:MAG: hydrolase [Bdellovibrionales bacterium]|nr:hydrolase [Bdellovibrionales bacterium]